jgi:hypothetical protein
VFSVQGTGGSPTGPDPENRVGDQDTGSRGRPVSSRLQVQCTVQTFTESEDTRCCVNTIFPPEDGHVNARNMSRIII